MLDMVEKTLELQEMYKKITDNRTVEEEEAKNTALTTAAVSDTPAVYSCSSQTTVTVTVPFPSSRAVLVSAIPCTFPVGTASPDVFALPSSVISGTSTSSLMSGCPDISGLSAGLVSVWFSG